jgi:hypothetical protein
MKPGPKMTDAGVEPGSRVLPTETAPTKNKTSVRKRQDDATWRYYAKSISYLLCWSLVSGLIIILNNWIMHYDAFPFPITLSATVRLHSCCIQATLESACESAWLQTTLATELI